jgi:hypothetical protein
VRCATEQYERIKAMNGRRTRSRSGARWAQLMTENMTVVRYNDRWSSSSEDRELRSGTRNIGVSDVAGWTNQVIPFTRQLRTCSCSPR